MSEDRSDSRFIWSCGFGRLPQEEEIAALKDVLRDPDTSFWDDAAALRRYLELTGLSQAAGARALCRSQAAVANRLRLLKLPKAVALRMRTASLTERHARALLRLDSEAEQLTVLSQVENENMTVAETEALVEQRLRLRSLEREPLELKELLSVLQRLRRGCPEVDISLEEREDDVVISLRLPKKIL